MNEKVILTDCDGVLLDWVNKYCQWMLRQGYVMEMYPDATYEMEKVFGIPKAECKKTVRMFNESADIQYMPPLRDAIKYVKKLHEDHGFVFRAITSLSLSVSAKKARVANLEALFGATVFEDVVCLDTGADKDEALEQYRDSGMVWIEDKPENVELGKKLGLDCIMVDHGFNRGTVEDVFVAKTWKEIYEYLT
jgi:beta-phosphoglucomutase-like phosphatase (HAD superfamily)|tara:strand:+ start:31154 stop:31732 length:579 start_codon:yes stop_codon:yes gene_type:complete